MTLTHPPLPPQIGLGLQLLALLVLVGTTACSSGNSDDTADDGGTCSLSGCVGACVAAGRAGGSCVDGSCICIGGGDGDADVDDANADDGSSDAADVPSDADGEVSGGDADDGGMTETPDTDAEDAPAEETALPECGNGVPEEGEECDGDGPRSCDTICGTEGSQACVSCAWETTCTPPAEMCNGEDDDCDGASDEDFPTLASACDGPDTDLCANGVVICRADGAGVVCGTESITEIAESCDGADNDCDGETDETFACIRDAAGGSCTTACGVVGSSTCSATCTLGSCCASSEICGNGCDDDCDSLTDEGCGTTVGTPCTSDAACAGGGLVCNENWGICVVASCTGLPNFRPCETITSPDRSYDICVAGSCVSPGCGDASCNAPGPNRTLSDTSQRFCYDATTSITCAGRPGTADCETTAFCGQDAQYGWDATHAAADRFTRSVPAPGQPVVADNVTALSWQGCPQGMVGDIGSCTGTASTSGWATALADCASLSWGGYADWRLPNQYELHSLVDYGRSGAPTIEPTAFPATPSDRFWSSSSYAEWPFEAWGVDFSSTVVDHGLKTTTFFVRCVRGGNLAGVPVPRFTRTEPVSGFAVTADVATGLVWQGCTAGLTGSGCAGSVARMNWQTALDYCQDSTWAGFADWYLPNMDELHSIVDDQRTSPSADATAFPATPSDRFWSSSSLAGATSNAWFVNFSDGSTDYYGGKVATFFVRCVRRGP